MVTNSDLVGFLASNLVLMTFVTKDMRRLRTIAIFSNITFIAYGALAWLPPVLCLHLALLPLNLLRLWQVLQSEQHGSAPDANLRRTISELYLCGLATLGRLKSRLPAITTRHQAAPI